jgi:hypothetical protein
VLPQLPEDSPDNRNKTDITLQSRSASTIAYGYEDEKHVRLLVKRSWCQLIDLNSLFGIWSIKI